MLLYCRLGGSNSLQYFICSFSSSTLPLLSFSINPFPNHPHPPHPIFPTIHHFLYLIPPPSPPNPLRSFTLVEQEYVKKTRTFLLNLVLPPPPPAGAGALWLSSMCTYIRHLMAQWAWRAGGASWLSQTWLCRCTYVRHVLALLHDLEELEPLGWARYDSVDVLTSGTCWPCSMILKSWSPLAEPDMTL